MANNGSQNSGSADTSARADIDRLAKEVLFVCTGNYYRSRLSELLFRYHAERTGLDWDTNSMGLLNRTSHAGLSPSATRYLEKVGLAEMAALPREPQVATLDDLLRVRLVVALNRVEHEPLLRQRFGHIPSELHKLGRLRFWNVFDIPVQSGWTRILNWKEDPGSQPETSGGEHIDFAVQTLVAELARQEK
jgi:protein-tyrosine phosphatase